MSSIKLSYQLDMREDSVWITATPAQAAKDALPHVQELGDFITGAGYYTRRENLPSYLIKYTISGEGILEFDGRQETIRPGQVFWIDCMKPQFYHTSSRKGEWRVLWVHFFGPTCEEYYRLFLAQTQGANTAYIGSDVSVKSALDALIAIYRGGNCGVMDDVQASALLTTLMARCVTAAGMDENCARIPSYVLDARDFINLNFTERITLDELAQRLNVNKFYLQKLFKRYMGLSPNEYLIRTRLTRAKELLRATNQTVGEISLDVGVSNIGHFIGMFKRHEGVTPMAYRRRWSSGEALEPSCGE